MPKLFELIKYKVAEPKVIRWPEVKEALVSFSKTAEAYNEKLINKSTYIGIEVEVENVGHMADEYYGLMWSAKEDHSLRNGGLEFISKAIKGEQIGYALASLDSSLRKEAKFSHRTSVHVHMNVRDLTPEELAKVVLVYTSVEKQLFSFCGDNREKNIFCVPLYSLGMTDSLFQAIKALDSKQMKQLQSETYRYSALNLEPVHRFGTIEFRHLGGTRDMNRLLTWINFIFSIKNYALTRPLDDLIKELIDLNTNSQYRAYAQRVFGDSFYKFDATELNTNIITGVLSVKRAMFSENFLKELRAGEFAGSAAQSIGTNLKLVSSKEIYDEPRAAAPRAFVLNEDRMPPPLVRRAERAAEIPANWNIPPVNINLGDFLDDGPENERR